MRLMNTIKVGAVSLAVCVGAAACGPQTSNTGDPASQDPNGAKPSPYPSDPVGQDPNGAAGNPNNPQDPNGSTRDPNGALDPNALPTTGFFAAALPQPSDPAPEGKLTLVLSSDPNFCANLAERRIAKDSTEVAMVLMGAGSASGGVYSIPAQASVSAVKLDAQCAGSPQSVSAGTVNLTSVNATAISGSVSLTLGAATGSTTFQATACPALSTTPPPFAGGATDPNATTSPSPVDPNGTVVTLGPLDPNGASGPVSDPNAPTPGNPNAPTPTTTLPAGYTCQ
jgi:hypothetical protein